MGTSTLMHSTRIAVVIEDDTGNLTQLIATVTVLVAMLVSFAHFVAEAALLASDVMEASRFTVAVFGIGFRAVMWGFFGIRI